MTIEAQPIIVVGIDGSPASARALIFAVEEAALRQATVRAVIAWSIPYDAGLAVAPSAYQEIAATELDRVVEALGDLHDVTIDRQVVEGPAGRILVAAAAGAELLVLGTRGHGRITGLLLGSVSQYVTAHAPCPVVITRGDPAVAAGGPASEPGRLDELGEADCLALLASRRYGRLAVVHDGHPEIFLVNFVIDGRTVAFRTGTGTKLDWATMGPVAFEVDGIDDHTHRGWVVQVRGLGRDVTDALDGWSEHLRSQPLVPWAEGDRSNWVALANPVFTGRSLVDPGPA